MSEKARRSSVFSSQVIGDVGGSCAALGGRQDELSTGSELLGSVECVILEPMGKRLAPTDFVTTGVVVCLQGMPSSPESLDEWGNATQSAGWLDMGITVVIPNLQMSPSLQLDDIATVVWASLELAGFDRCVLVGKDWGAQCCIQLAAEPTLEPRVAGVVLFGPDSPPCEACAELEVPALLMWACDDDVSPIEGLEEWLEALDGRPAPTSVKECEGGGHRVDSALQKSNESIVQALRKFTATSLLIADLGDDEEGDGDGSPLPSKVNKCARMQRLSVELPLALAPDSEAAETQKRRSSHDLANWIHSGMATASE